MNATSANCRLQVEQLEQRDAPATLTITPRSDHATPHTVTIAEQGCTHGITAHASAASDGVVKCS